MLDIALCSSLICATVFASALQSWSLMEREITDATATVQGGARQWLINSLHEADTADYPIGGGSRYVQDQLQRLYAAGSGHAVNRKRLIELTYLGHLMAFAGHAPRIRNTTRGFAHIIGVPELIARKFLEAYAVCETKQAGGMVRVLHILCSDCFIMLQQPAVYAVPTLLVVHIGTADGSMRHETS